MLVVAPTTLRAVSLSRTTETVLQSWSGGGTEFRFAALEHLQASGPCAEIWQVAGATGLHALTIEAPPDEVPA